MAVKDLEARQGNVNVNLEITEKGDVREFEKFGKKGRVCNAKGKDESGAITITLWNEDIDKINVGDLIKIENGWVSEWQGELQLSTGKFGKLEVVGKGSGEPNAETTPATEEPSTEENIPVDSEAVEEEVLDSLDEEPVVEEEITDDEENVKTE